MKSYIVTTQSTSIEISAKDIDEINGYLYLYDNEGKQVAIFADREWQRIILKDK